MKKVRLFNIKNNNDKRKKIYKLKRKFRDIKLTNCIIFVLILSISFLGIVGIMGQSAMRKINDNVDKIYNDELVSIIKIEDVKNDFLFINYNIAEAVDSKFYYEYEKDIRQNHEQISNSMEEYKKMKLDKYQKVYIDKITEDYLKYMDIWEVIKGKKKENSEHISKETGEINSLGKNIIYSINGLIKYNKLSAEKLKKDSEKVYNRNEIMLRIIDITAIVLLTVLSLIIVKNIKKSMKEMIEELELVSEGNFNVNIKVDSSNEFGVMKKALVKMIENISGTLKVVRENSEAIVVQSNSLSNVSQEMNLESKQVAVSIQNVAQGSISQSENLLDVDGSIDHVRDEMDKILAFIKEVEDNAERTGNVANKGNDELNLLIQAIQSINNSFSEVSREVTNLSNKIDRINSITNIINEIADQTNLLALNAAIEAARAGDVGRGFAVVADEIGQLANQSKTASKTINNLVSEISLGTNNVVDTTETVNNYLDAQNQGVKKSIDSFKEIVSSIEVILPKIAIIYEMMLGLNNKQNELMKKVNKVNLISSDNSDLSQQIAASSEEMNAAADEVSSTAQMLNSMSIKLDKEVNRFKLM